MTWQVRVHGDGGDLSSMLHLCRGAKMLDGSGMGGPPLCPGEPIHEPRGYSDDSPWHVLVRTHPDGVSVVATTERGARLDVPLSGVGTPAPPAPPPGSSDGWFPL